MTEQMIPPGRVGPSPDEARGPRRPVVTRLDLFPLKVPLSELARSAMDESATGLGMAIPAEEPWNAGDFVFARLEDEDGNEGWGEAFMWLPETGVSPAEVISSIVGGLARYILGSCPADLHATRARLDRNVTRNEVSKGLLDFAMADLAARQIDRPVHDLIGGRGCDELPLCGLVPLGDAESASALAAGYVRAGYGTVRVKLGTSPDADLEVMTAVREAVGPEVRLRVDYNQAYTVHGAIRALRLLEPLGIDAAEQPLRVGDVLGMAEVQRRVDIPLFLHEGAFCEQDILTLVELGGCGVLGINSERPGGLLPALRMIDYAASRGMGTIIHNQPLGLGAAMHVHMAAARFDVLGHAIELSGDVMFSASMVKDPLRASGGRLPVPSGAGWGVTVDRDALDDHASGEMVTMTVDHLGGHGD